MQKPDASTIRSVVARGLGKVKKVDSVRAVLLLFKRDLKSSVQTKGRLLGTEAEKRWRGWRHLE